MKIHDVGSKGEFSQEDLEYLYGDLSVNSTTMTKAVPHTKLRQMLDLRLLLQEIVAELFNDRGSKEKLTSLANCADKLLRS